MQQQNNSVYHRALNSIQKQNLKAGFLTINSQASPDHLNFGHWLVQNNLSLDAANWFKYLIDEKYPDPKLSYWCGVCYSSMAEFTLAQTWLKRALLDIENSELPYIALAQLYQTQNKTTEADVILRKMLTVFPEKTELWIKSGAFFMQSHDYQLAISFYQHVIETWPEQAMAYNDLANCYQHLGDFDKAQHHFMQALKKDPKISGAYIGIASSKKFNDAADQTITFLQQKLAEADTPQLTACIDFATAKIFDDLKNYPLAWKHVESANKICANNSSWSAADWRHNIDNIIRLFPEPKPQAAEHATNIPTPVFIVGMPRSGTTLLEKQLSRIAGVSVAGELDAIDNILASLKPSATQLTLTYPKSLAIHPHTISLRKYYLTFAIAAAKADDDCRWIVDKNPLNFVHLGLIKTLFPEAIIIHTKRQPLDVLISNYFQYFAHDNLAYSFNIKNIIAFIQSYQHLIKHWRKLFGNNKQHFIEIDYELLVTSTEKITAIFQQLFETDVVRQQPSQGVITSASIWQARQPVYSSSISRWENYQSQLQPYRGLLKPWLK